MRKILLFSSSGSLYGSERGLLNLIDALDGKYELMVVVPAGGELTERIKTHYPRVQIKTFPLPILALTYSPFYYFNFAVLSLLNIAYFIPLVIRNEIDIVCTNNLLLPVSALIAKIAQKKHIWFVREFFTPPLANAVLSRIIATLSDRVIFQSYFIKKKLGDKLSGKVIYEPLIEKNYRIYDKTDARQQLKLPKEKKIISLISRIHPGKGQYEFIKKFTAAFDDDNDVILLLVGDVSFPSLKNRLYKRKIINYIRQRRDRKIIFKGFVGEIDKIISSVDVCVFPFIKEEPFGIAVAECLSFNKSVFFPKKGGLREIHDIFCAGNELSMRLLKESVTNIEKFRTDSIKKLNIPRRLSKPVYEKNIIEVLE